MRADTETLIAKYGDLLKLMKQEDGVTEFEYKRLTDPLCAPWGKTLIPQWNFNEFKYRVKPKKPVEIWVWKYPSGLIGQGSYDNKQPDDTSGHSRVMVLMREVTE